MTRARLMAVEIKGFKSFAKEARLDFGPGMTAVIGPNGSGKSNLAEAIRWVLGEQSIKQLRGKERLDVIFAGNEDRSRAQKATVALTFDNADEWFPLPATEIEIRRELTLGGESSYLLNGEVIRLIDLQQMLAEAGIGSKSFTVISQGMVDRYLTVGPEKRQELFDEATGIKSLQITLQQAERRLVVAEEHAEELKVVLAELKPRLIVLERQMAREKERGELSKIFEEKQAAWLRGEWQARQRQSESARARYEAIQEEITRARRKREKAEEALVARAKAATPSRSDKQQQLWRAEQEFQQQQDAYESRRVQRAALERQIGEITALREAAERTLEIVKEKMEPDHADTGTRAALMECLELLRAWMAGNSMEKTRVRQVIEAAEKVLQAPSSTTASDYEELLKQLEGPLQEVARLQTKEEERRRQLEQLPALLAPKPETVAALRATMQEEGEDADAASSAQAWQETLAAARDKEIAAEREGSAARAALQQSHGELHELEEVVLRERGSEFWLEIQNGASEAGETVRIEELRALEQRMHQLGEIDPLAKKEYAEVRQRHDELTDQLTDITQTAANIRKLQTDLMARLTRQFEQKLEVIRQAFGQYFVRLFGGGQAALEQVEEGIDITVAPPGKRARHMALLSGGERALTSLALLLAILEASKPPFIVLDEVDAALDEANSRRLAAILREKSQETQCIIITHNRESMGKAERLYGVTMQQDGVSKVYSVELSDLPVEADVMAV